MDDHDWKKVSALVTDLWPRIEMSDAVGEVWREGLKAHQGDAVMWALRQWKMDHKFAPQLSEIRNMLAGGPTDKNTDATEQQVPPDRWEHTRRYWIATTHDEAGRQEIRDMDTEEVKFRVLHWEYLQALEYSSKIGVAAAYWGWQAQRVVMRLRLEPLPHPWAGEAAQQMYKKEMAEQPRQLEHQA